MTARQEVSIDMLREALTYDKETGKLYWRERPASHFPTVRDANKWNARYPGREAFMTLVNGYAPGHVFNRAWLAHRVVWALHYGEWPSGQIDHVDGRKSHNVVENLRVVSNAENNKNKPRPKNNTSGHVGVSWNKRDQRWIAHICVEGRSKQIGAFRLKDDAIAARNAAAVAYGFHENHGRAA